MKHIVIKNLGPIKDVDINLNRFNFFIGPQSSGKSTIAKVISTCEWVEKEVVTTLDENAVGNGTDFKALMEMFHKMDGYFDYPLPTTILYETESVFISYNDGEFKVVIKDESSYYRQKISYIPAERNMVTLPELDGFEFKNTNLKSFLFDWWRARDFYSPNNKTDVLGLGYNYYYDGGRSDKKDRVQHVNGVTYDISLSDSSSGLQSVTPLFVMLEYYSNQYFKDYDAKSSYKDDNKQKRTREAFIRKYILEKINPDYAETDIRQILNDVTSRLHRMEPDATTMFGEYEKALNRMLIPTRLTFIIEEPEQNLFPETQVALLQYIMRVCDKNDNFGCTITTHSPYILYALNNCLLAWLVRNKVDADTQKTNNAIYNSINPEQVSVWSIKDGCICNENGEFQKTLQDERGLIRKNYFNDIMKNIMREFNELLTYDD